MFDHMTNAQIAANAIELVQIDALAKLLHAKGLRLDLERHVKDAANELIRREIAFVWDCPDIRLSDNECSSLMNWRAELYNAR